jgi:transposase InsO family protein
MISRERRIMGWRRRRVWRRRKAVIDHLSLRGPTSLYFGGAPLWLALLLTDKFNFHDAAKHATLPVCRFGR